VYPVSFNIETFITYSTIV